MTRRGAQPKAPDPLLLQADIPQAQRRSRDYEIVRLAEDPNGDVIVRGEVKRHEAVRIRPAWREMLARGVFKGARYEGRPVPVRHIEAALEWYSGRLTLSGAYSVKSALDFTGGGGTGGPRSHVPTTEVALQAQDDIRLARSAISSSCLPVFHAVMHEDVSLIESARRSLAGRYTRASLNRMRAKLSDQFVMAACELAVLHFQAWVPQGDGRIRVVR